MSLNNNNNNNNNNKIPSGVTEYQYLKALNKIKRRSNTSSNSIPNSTHKDLNNNINTDADHLIVDTTNYIDNITTIDHYNYNIMNNERLTNIISHRNNTITNDNNQVNHIPTHTTTIDSAALQSDISRKYNLTTTSNIGNILRINRNRTTINHNSITILPNICGSCHAVNDNILTICTKCGYYMNCIIQPTETLAQRRGLVPVIPKIESMTALSW